MCCIFHAGPPAIVELWRKFAAIALAMGEKCGIVGTTDEAVGEWSIPR